MLWGYMPAVQLGVLYVSFLGGIGAKLRIAAAAPSVHVAGAAPQPAPVAKKSKSKASADKRQRARDIANKPSYARLAAKTQARKAIEHIQTAAAAATRPPRGVTTSRNGSVKVVTINVKTFRNSSAGSDGKTDPRAFKAITEYINRVNPDVVLLQELDSGTERSNKRDQIADFAKAVKADDYKFARAIDKDTGGYGVGIVTRNGHHIERNAQGQYRAQRIELPKGQGDGADPEQRIALVAPIVTPGGKEFTAVATHVTQKGPGRGAQIDKLGSIVDDVRDGARSSQAGLSSDLPTTVVVGGDFNTSRTNVEDHIGRGVRHVGHDVSSLGDTNIDHILVSDDVAVSNASLDSSARIGWRALHLGPIPTGVVPITATDHPALQATLELP